VKTEEVDANHTRDTTTSALRERKGEEKRVTEKKNLASVK
jgi:hypothetical protein